MWVTLTDAAAYYNITLPSMVYRFNRDKDRQKIGEKGKKYYWLNDTEYKEFLVIEEKMASFVVEKFVLSETAPRNGGPEVRAAKSCICKKCFRKDIHTIWYNGETFFCSNCKAKDTSVVRLTYRPVLHPLLVKFMSCQNFCEVEPRITTLNEVRRHPEWQKIKFDIRNPYALCKAHRFEYKKLIRKVISMIIEKYGCIPQCRISKEKRLEQAAKNRKNKKKQIMLEKKQKLLENEINESNENENKTMGGIFKGPPHKRRQEKLDKLIDDNYLM